MAQAITVTDVISQVVISEVAERSAPPAAADTHADPTRRLLTTAGDRPLAALDPAERNGMFNVPPEMTLGPGVDYTARIVTDQGDIVVDLFEDKAPVTVNNFVTLANLGFCDNTDVPPCHRGLYGAGGRSDQHRHGRPWLHLRG